MPGDVPNVELQQILVPPAVALSAKAGCIISGQISGVALDAAREHCARNRGRTLVQFAGHMSETRPLNLIERARALGQPDFEVAASSGGFAVKAGLLGRSLATGQILHLLGPLVRAWRGEWGHRACHTGPVGASTRSG